MTNPALGIGVYTAPDAARMIGMHASTLRRWLLGYDHHGKSEAPLWEPQYDPDDGAMLLGFRDLVEARVVNALKKRGFGLPTIRTCIDRARQYVGDERPFSTQLFKTDGRSIFVQIARDLDDPELIDLKKRQSVFHRVVEPTLDDLDFGKSGAERWWLLPKRRSVVADPTIAFGAPSVSGTGMTTARVVQAVEAEGSIARAAKVYDLKPRQIRDAIEYETMLYSRKAA